MRFLFALTLVLSTAAVPAQSPCQWFDHNGDGFLGANTWLYVLGQYGTNGPMDLDANGVVDVTDLVAFVPYFGHSCPVAWHDTVPEPHLLGLVLEEWAVHDEPLAGLGDTLPAGAVTYRLYAEVADPGDRVLAGFGHEDAPLVMETDGVFYGFGTEGPLDAVVVTDVNPIVDLFAPANAYTSWLTMGLEPGDEGYIAYLDLAEGLSDSALVMNHAIGGAWFDQGYTLSGQTVNGLVLLGQFTTIGSTTFSGTLNLLLESYPEDSGHAIELAHGLTFNSGDLDVLGCTDPTASNFNPAATFPFGPCLSPGDLNGNGEIGLSDFLELLEQFGCGNCPSADFNGDGVVSIQDILLFLTWL